MISNVYFTLKVNHDQWVVRKLTIVARARDLASQTRANLAPLLVKSDCYLLNVADQRNRLKIVL